MLIGEREMYNMLPGDMTAGDRMQHKECKARAEVVIKGVRRRAKVFVGDSIVRKTDRGGEEESEGVCGGFDS